MGGESRRSAPSLNLATFPKLFSRIAVATLSQHTIPYYHNNPATKSQRLPNPALSPSDFEVRPQD